MLALRGPFYQRTGNRGRFESRAHDNVGIGVQNSIAKRRTGAVSVLYSSTRWDNDVRRVGPRDLVEVRSIW